MKIKKACIISLFLAINFIQYAAANINDSIYVRTLIDSSLRLRHNNEAKAIELAMRAYKIASDSSFAELEIDAMNVYGLLYYATLEKLDSGYYFVTKAFEKSKQINYQKGMCYYTFFKGATEVFRGNYKKAEILYYDALQIAEKFDNPGLMGHIFSALSTTSMRTGNYDEAISHIRMAYNYYAKINDPYETSNADMKTGYLYALQDSLNKAKIYYSKVINTLEELNDSIRILFPKTYLSMVYIKEKDYTKAALILNNIIRKLRNSEYFDLYISACSSLSKVYKSVNKFEQAYFYQNEAYRVRDSVYTLEKFDRVYEVQMAYEKAKKEKEANELIRANEIKSLELKNTRNVAILVCSLLLLLSILLFVISKRHKFAKEVAVKLQNQQDLIHKQENEKIRQKLEYQKRDLTSKVFQLSQNNELGKRLVNSLKSLQLKIKTKGPIGEELRTHVQSIINEIKFTSNTQMWDEFELYFNKVNPGFINWLSKHYPELTKNEIRLCTFSLLNLKTNEISKVTFQNNKTINVARTRLRKKLGLDNKNITLTTYLHRQYSGLQNEMAELG